MNIINNLDDATLIKEFISGKKQLVFNQNLCVEPVSNNLQLLTKKGLLLATLNEAGLYKIVFVKPHTNYCEIIHNNLLEHSIMPTDKLEHGLMRYEYNPIPLGYQIHHAESNALWKIWRQNLSHKATQNTSHKLDIEKPLSILAFTNEGWQPVIEIAYGNESVFIKTCIDEIVVHMSDRIFWSSPKEDTEIYTVEKEKTTKNETETQGITAISKINLPEIDTEIFDEPVTILQTNTWNITQIQENSEQYKTSESLTEVAIPTISKTKSHNSTNNILSVFQGKLYIQTIEGEIVVEGSNLKFWFSPPEGKNIKPQIVEVK
jgi:hypothetical protein